MDKGKIVFINEKELLIMEIAPSTEINPFMKGILLYLTLNNSSNEQPIKITSEGRNGVIDFLNRKYSKAKEVNRLIKFFRDLPIHNYIYIYSYDEKSPELYDTLKESLLYYNKGETDEIIALKIEQYIAEKEKIMKCLDDYPYEIQMIVPNKKVIIGEKEKQKRKCIYCGGSINDGKTKYKEIAHAIPEALGNKKFIQNEECDACNDYFAANAEEDLCNFLIGKRLRYGLKGKNGYPIFQITNGRYARYLNYEEAESNWGPFEHLKSFIKENKIKTPVIIAKEFPKEKNDFEISYVRDYIPQHVYKTLVKCVIGLIGNDNLSPFEKTIDWVRYKNNYVKLPKVVLVKSKRLIMEPELYIFKRKEINDYRIPYCYAELRVLDIIFVYIIPFTENDKYEFIEKEESQVFMKLISETYGEGIVQDFSSIIPQIPPKIIAKFFSPPKE